jgi:hypothetical protein
MSWNKFWRFRLMELGVAVGIVAGMAYVTDFIQQRFRADIPAENWFVVNDIYVPDFTVGGNPPMTYDRIIKEPFIGFWVVEVEREDGGGRFILECSGSGVNDYQVADYIPKNTVTWDWFIGRHCDLTTPGRYRLRASWKMRRYDWPEKTVVAYSNVFAVER